MILHAAVLGCWTATLARSWSTFVKGPRPMWRVSFALAMLFVTMAATARYEPWLVDSSTSHSSELVSYACLLLGMGLTNCYVDSLQQREPTWHASRGHLLTAIALVAVLVTAWTQIPHVHREQADSTVIGMPMTTPLVIFLLATYVPLVPTLIRVAAHCWESVRDHSREHAPGSRAGLSMIGAFSGLGAVSFLMSDARFLMRWPGQLPESRDAFMMKFIPVMNGVALLGLAAGALTLWATPAWSQRVRERRRRRDLDVLWRWLTARHPQVCLATTDGPSPTRKLIEVHDALMLEPVPSDQRGATPGDVARHLLDGSRRGTMPAERALAIDSPDEDPVPRLAAEFRRQSRGRGHRASHPSRSH